jgi:hypothetical protein
MVSLTSSHLFAVGSRRLPLDVQTGVIWHPLTNQVHSVFRRHSTSASLAPWDLALECSAARPDARWCPSLKNSSEWLGDDVDGKFLDLKLPRVQAFEFIRWPKSWRQLTRESKERLDRLSKHSFADDAAC